MVKKIKFGSERFRLYIVHVPPQRKVLYMK
jgi:hypothetical protein